MLTVLTIVSVIQSIAIIALFKKEKVDGLWKRVEIMLTEWKHGQKAAWELEFNGRKPDTKAPSNTGCTVVKAVQKGSKTHWKCACGHSARADTYYFGSEVSTHKRVKAVIGQ